MKLLFLALATSGCGETTIGLSMARSLQQDGFDPHVVIDSFSEPLLRGTNLPYTTTRTAMGSFTPLVVDEVIRTHRPDAIVLSDYFTYFRTMAHVYQTDPWFIDDYGIPVLPVDIWEWDRTSFEIDVFMGEGLKVSSHILGYDTWLRPVPLCHIPPMADAKRRLFLVDERPNQMTRRTRAHVRETLGLGPDDRLVMFALAKWQLPRFENEHGNRIARAVPALIAHYLSQMPSNVHVLNVGERLPDLDGIDPGRVHWVPTCSAERFDVLLGSTDLFLGLNLASTTLARAVLLGVDGLVLTNTESIDDRDGLEAHGTTGSAFTDRWLADTLPIFPFRMWPLGFHSFIAPLLVDNSYLRTFQTVELLDAARVVETMTQLLRREGGSSFLASGREEYIASLGSISPIAAQFRELLSCGSLVTR